MCSLALRYRPRTFADVIGQDLVVSVLKKVVSDGMSYRSLLFSGCYGSGKTSLARILAATLNCKGEDRPCGECANCKAIEVGDSTNYYLEVDGGSYGTVDNIRKIQSFVTYIPMGADYIVVVIDECHNLSKEAFNACLKLIEDPPDRAVFIFATTERDKVPDTIRSRCLDLRFKRVGVSEIAARLGKIALQEGLEVDGEVLEEIAEYSQGVVRDSVTLLEQLALSSDGRVTKESMGKHVALSGVSFFDLTMAIKNKDLKQKNAFIVSFISSNGDYLIFAKAYLRYLRNYYCWKLNLRGIMKKEELEEFEKLDMDLVLVYEVLKKVLLFASRLGFDRDLASCDFNITVLNL